MNQRFRNEAARQEARRQVLLALGAERRRQNADAPSAPAEPVVQTESILPTLSKKTWTLITTIAAVLGLWLSYSAWYPSLTIEPLSDIRGFIPEHSPLMKNALETNFPSSTFLVRNTSHYPFTSVQASCFNTEAHFEGGYEEKQTETKGQATNGMSPIISMLMPQKQLTFDCIIMTYSYGDNGQTPNAPLPNHIPIYAAARIDVTAKILWLIPWTQHLNFETIEVTKNQAKWVERPE